MSNSRTRIGLLALALWAAQPAGAVEAPQPPVIAIAVDTAATPTITLETHAAPLRPILDELAARTGTTIHYSILPEAPVTATCAGDSPKSVLRCLLGKKTDFLIRTVGANAQAKAGKVSEIWVLGSSLVRETTPAGNAAVCTAAAGEPKDPRKQKEASEAAKLKKEQIEQAMTLLQSANPNERADALARLRGDGLVEDKVLRGILEHALQDSDSNVRAKAIWELAQNGGPGVAALLRTAIADTEPAVRQMAVDAAGNNAEGMALLQTAAGDADEGIRTLAWIKLETFKAAAAQP